MDGTAPEEGPQAVMSQDIDYDLGWDGERLDRLGRRVTNQIETYLTATKVRRENLKKWRRDWDLMPEEVSGEDDGPFSGSSDITTADTRRSCNAHHSRLNQQILLLDPPFAVIARDDEAVAAIPQIEDALPALLEEANWQEVGDELHRELPLAGNAFLRVTYDVERKPRPYYQGDLDVDMAQARVQSGQDPITAGFDSLKKDAQGRVMRKLAFKDQIIRHGIVFKAIPWEDGIILPPTARDASEAYGIGERVMVTGEELRGGVKTGKYLKDAVDELLQMPPDGLDDDMLEALDLQGVNPPASGTETDILTEDGDIERCLYHSYLCWEMCYLLDGNGDGSREWCWLLVHPGSRKVLRAQYVPWEHGEAHYHHFRYLTRTGRLWAQGIAEMIASFQDGRSAAFNQQIDWAELAIRLGTTMMVDERSGINPDTFELVLGKVIEVDSVEGVKQLVLPPLSPEHAAIPGMLKEEIDLLTGASDPAMGKEAAGQHTLGEIQIAQSNGNLHFENTAASVARQWAKVWDQCRFLIAQHGEGEDIPYRRSALPGARIQIDGNGMVQPANAAADPMAAMGGNPLPGLMPGMPSAPPNGAAPMPETGTSMGVPPPMAPVGPAALPQVGGMPAPAGPMGATPQSPNPMAPVPPIPPPPQFGTITSDMLRRRVDLVPAGLAHMSDFQSRIQQAQITYNTVMALPIVQSNPQVVLLVLDYYLQQLRVPIRQQLIQKLEETYMMLAGQAAAMQQQQQQAAAGQLGAQAAGQEAQLQGALADTHGIGPSQFGRNGSGMKAAA
jgi:hypothetical protein